MFGAPFAPGAEPTKSVPLKKTEWKQQSGYDIGVTTTEWLQADEAVRRFITMTEDEARILLTMYAECRNQASEMNRVREWIRDGQPTDSALEALHWAELFSVVITSMCWWAGKAEDAVFARTLMVLVAEGTAMKAALLESPQGRELARFAFETSGIIAF